MKIEEEVKIAVSTFCKMKRAMCERENGPYDLAPMLHFKYSHLKTYCGMLLAGDPVEMVPPAWGRILEDGIPEFVMLMVEAYASENVDNYRKGAMEQDFKNNPDSRVREAITIQAVDIKTGRQMTGIVRYVYGDDGLPVFDEPSIGECEGKALECRVPSIIGMCRDQTLKIGRVA